jgi:hypothetical protein
MKQKLSVRDAAWKKKMLCRQMLPYYFYGDVDANNSKEDAASMMSNLDIMIYCVVECCHIIFVVNW